MLIYRNFLVGSAISITFICIFFLVYVKMLNKDRDFIINSLLLNLSFRTENFIYESLARIEIRRIIIFIFIVDISEEKNMKKYRINQEKNTQSCDEVHLTSININIPLLDQKSSCHY